MQYYPIKGEIVMNDVVLVVCVGDRLSDLKNVQNLRISTYY